MPSPPALQTWILQALAENELPLLRYALRLVGDEHAARDVVQYAFMRLCGETPRDYAEGPTRWLYTVVRHRSLDWLRQRNGHAKKFEELQQAETHESDEACPAEQAEQQELWQLVREQVDRLPLPQREAVVLWSEGLAYAEIASITGRKEGELRVSVHRGLNTLRANAVLRHAVQVNEKIVNKS